MNPNIGNDNCPTCCANRREDRRIVDGYEGYHRCADSWHTTPPAPADDASGAEAMREAFIAHMASLGTTGVVWTPNLGPVGYRNDRHSAFLTVEWERFAAGYRAALPAAPAHDAVRSATERVVNAWRRMDAHGSDAELRRAVDALYEAWTDAAERAQDAQGGDRG